MYTIGRKLALAATGVFLAVSAFGATSIGNTSADDVTLGDSIPARMSLPLAGIRMRA